MVNQCHAETYIYGDDMYSIYSQDVILEPFDIDISDEEIKVLYGRFIDIRYLIFISVLLLEKNCYVLYIVNSAK